MEKLKGKSILVGKEPGRGRLLIAIENTGKSGAVGSDGCVPNSVSRCKPDEGVAHARIEIDNNGHAKISNLKPQNVTYVNGKEIVSKRITHNDTIALGKDLFTISLAIVLEAAKKLLGSQAGSSSAGGSTGSGGQTPEKPTYNIRHLEKVYNDYQNELKEIARKQQEMQKKRMLPIMVGSFSGLASPILIAMEITSPLFVTIPVAAISFGLYLHNYNKKDTSIEDREAALEKFTDDYVCPNPECVRFFGNISYKLLKKNYHMECPYCHAKFTE